MASFLLLSSLLLPLSAGAADPAPPTAGGDIKTLESMHAAAEKLVIEGRFREAVELFMRMSKSEQFDEFLSLPAYELLP